MLHSWPPTILVSSGPELFVLCTFLVQVKACSYCTGIGIKAIPVGPAARQMHNTQPLSNCLFIASPSFALSRCLYSCNALKVTVHIMNSLLLSCRSKNSFPVLSLSFLLKWSSLLLCTRQESLLLGAAGLSFSDSQLFALCLSLGRLYHSGSDTSSWETIWSRALLLSPTCYWDGNFLTPNCIFSWWENILHQESAHVNGKLWEWQGYYPVHH